MSAHALEFAAYRSVDHQIAGPNNGSTEQLWIMLYGQLDFAIKSCGQSILQSLTELVIDLNCGRHFYADSLLSSVLQTRKLLCHLRQ